MPAGGPRVRLSTWLLRPYLDLGPLEIGPLHASAVEACWRAFADPAHAPFVAQRAMPPAFRVQLAGEAGRPYALDDPRQLPDRLRTRPWRTMCAALDDWRDLGGDVRCRLASLLHSLCLYRPLLALIPEWTGPARGADRHAVELAFWRASAAFMLGLPSRTADYAAADLAVFEDIALNAPDLVPVSFDATAMVFVHKAKTGAPLADLAEWSRRFEAALARATAGAAPFAADLFTSRFHRGMGFLPQRSGDRPGVVRAMDLAERHARRLTPATPEQEILYRENLHAMLESRTKEALWLEDTALALARARGLVEADPCDAKAWAELGEVRYLRREWGEAAQAYGVAAMLGPPASAVARHMAGVCFRETGQDLLAALFFKDTLEIDPLGISPREEIQDLPDIPALGALRRWSRLTAEQALGAAPRATRRPRRASRAG